MTIQQSKQVHKLKGQRTLRHTAKCSEILTCQHNPAYVHLPVYGINSQHSISADISMAVLKTGPDGRHERLKKLWLLQLAQETQC